MLSKGELIASKMKRNAELANARREAKEGVEGEIRSLKFIVKYTLYATVFLCVGIWSAAIILGWFVWPLLVIMVGGHQ